MIVPVFPLPEACLFPGQVQPLLIFEPRYRQMVEDLLDNAGRLVLATLVPGEVESPELPPAFHPVAGLGEISGHERFPDGRYLIALLGIGRVRLEEVPSDRLYRQVRIEPLIEEPVPESRSEALRDALETAVRARSSVDIPGGLALERLVDLLLIQMELPTPELQPIFSESDLARRAERALIEHRAR